MSELTAAVFVTIIPLENSDHEMVRSAIAAEGLPVDEQTQFAGKAAFETAVEYTRGAIASVAYIARKLLDADRIEEITVEYKDRKVVLRGVPADKAKTVNELTEHIFTQLQQ